MNRLLRICLIFMAIEAAYAVCAAFITDTNPYPAAAILAGAGFAWLLEDTRPQRLAGYRARVRARRDREAGAS